MLFDVQSNSAWCYEIGEYQAVLYLAVAGASFNETFWLHSLGAGERYVSDKTVICFADSIDGVFSESICYKRRTRLPSVDAFADKIVYNPYMHNAGEYPDEKQTLRDLESVKNLDIDVFCIDAGWHGAEQDYWKAIGEWEESGLRFPSGLKKTTDAIHAAGFSAGLWIEPEMTGWFNGKKNQLPDDCYFCRGGKPCANNGRIQLDFRRERVRGKVRSILERLIKDYGLSYMKFDFNADCVVGTDVDADSPGDGLKKASDASFEFYREFLTEHGDVAFENCASGGLRLDGKMQSLFAIHSTSDQTDYRLYPYIAANMLTNGAPEQMGVWCYPLENQTDEQVVMNVVNTVLGRMQLSGQIWKITPRQKEIIAEGIKLHRRFAEFKKRAYPVFPKGLNRWGDNSVCAALSDGELALLAVWHFDGDERVEIPLEKLPRGDVQCVFPSGAGDFYSVSGETLGIDFKGEQARVFLLKKQVCRSVQRGF